MPPSGAGGCYGIIDYFLEAFDWCVCPIPIPAHFSTSSST
jgi:hypothetical protein